MSTSAGWPTQLLAAALLAIPVSSARAGDDAAASEETLYIRARKLIQRPGEVIENAAVIVRGGRIVAVGSGLSKPDGAREIEGEYVCAGFLDPWAAIGMTPEALADGTTTPSTRASDGLDAYGQEHLRREALRAGVTCVRLQAGAASRVSGIGVLVRTAPGLAAEHAIVEAESNVAMSIGLSANVEGQPRIEQQGDAFVLVPGSKTMDPFDRIAELDRIVAAIEAGKNHLIAQAEYRHELEEWKKKIAEKEAELEKDAKKAKKDREKEEKEAKEKGKEFQEKKYKEDKQPSPPRHDDDHAVMARVADGKLPLVVQANRAAEIRGLLQATAGYDRLRLVVAGGAEATCCAKELAERRVPVLVWPALRGKDRPDEYDAADATLAARLAKEGVEVLIGSGGFDAGASRDLPLLAEIAVGAGLDRETAFEALTLGAARTLDAADRLGSIERGKDADLIVLDGEPLSSAARVRYVITMGRVVVTPED